MYFNFSEKHIEIFFVRFFIYNQHFLPFGRVDNTQLLCCDAFVARSKATWQSHVSAEHHEVTTLSAIVRDELHTSTPRICSILDS